MAEEKPLFKKGELLKAKKYAQYRDLLNALLEDNGEYTLEDVDTMISRFLKGKVK